MAWTPTFTLTDATGKELISRKNPGLIKEYYDFELEKDSIEFPLELNNDVTHSSMKITKETTAEEWREYRDSILQCC